MKRDEGLAPNVRLMNAAAIVLFAVFVLACALALTRWVAAHKVFAFQGITVIGDVNHCNAATVRAHVVSRVKGTFFSMDLSSTREAFEAIPWVRKAVVHRDFPNHLRVKLQEHQVVAYWGDESEQRLLNSYGEVFDANTGEVEQYGLPRLNGPKSQSAQVLAAYRLMVPQFTLLNLTIESVDLSVQGSWRITLAGGALIEAGRGDSEELAKRTQAFLKTLTRVVARYSRPLSALESADLRHENGYAIRLRGVSTLATSTSPTP
jgi:cell division protein FtsQ